MLNPIHFKSVFTIFDQERVCFYNAFGYPDLLTSILSSSEINAIDVTSWVHWLSG